MYSNNKSYYVDVHTQNYAINRFARKVIRKRWCDLTIAKFLTFGVLGNYDKMKIIATLNKYCPTWGAYFWLYVMSSTFKYN